MGLFAALFHKTEFLQKNSVAIPKMQDFVFYKIIDYDENLYQCFLQCINTSQMFRASLVDIINDFDILYGLHPIQACFVGMEYAKYLRKKQNLSENKKISPKVSQCGQSRYGRYSILYYKKNGYFVLLCKESGRELTESAYNLAFSKEWMQDFDANEAFYIGQEAYKILMNSTHSNDNRPQHNNVYYLSDFKKII